MERGLKIVLGIVFLGFLVGIMMIFLQLSEEAGGSFAPGARSSSAPGAAAAPSRGGAMRGVVVDAQGAPIAGATVSAGERYTLTDEGGRFGLEAMRAGEYRVDARAEGFVSPGPEAMRGVEVTLAGGSSDVAVDDLVLTLRRPGSISGRVVAGGRPIEGAELGLYYIRADGLVEPLPPYALDDVAASGAEGNFSLEGLAPGRLRVTVSVPEEVGDYGYAESREIALDDGEQVEGLVIDVQPGGTVAGHVVDTSGEPVRDAEVVVSGEALPLPRRAEADSRGAFRFDHVPSGQATVVVRARGYRTETLRDVEVAADDPAVVDVVLEPAQGLFGRVLGPDSVPTAGAFVSLTIDDRRQIVRSGADGTFAWPDGDAEAVVQVVHPRYASPPDALARPGEELVVRLGPGSQIRGQVVGPNRRPVTSYEIAVESFEVDGWAPYGNRVFGTESIRRSDGVFEVGLLRPGVYRLRAQAPGFAPGTSDAVRVDVGQLVGGLVIRLGSGSAVVGAVTDEGGEPVAGAQVTLFDPASPFPPITTRTDRAGNYRVEGVPAGRRSVRVAASSYLAHISGGIAVPEEGEVRRDVVLERAEPGESFSFHGIGAVLAPDDDAVVIRDLIEGQGAELYGLERGDRIVAVDRETTRDMNLEQIVERIRGEEGVPVELEVEREGEGRFVVEVERGRVVIKQQQRQRGSQ